MWSEEGPVLRGPEAGPELPPVSDVTVMKEEMVDCPSQGPARPWAETVDKECEVLSEASPFCG